jgi:hypothetical protein
MMSSKETSPACLHVCMLIQPIIHSTTVSTATSNESLSDYILLVLWLYSPCTPWSLFQFSNVYTVGRTPWTGDQLIARPLPTHRTTQTQNKRTQTSMPRVGFEPTIPVFERAKTVHALDQVVTVIG